MEMHIHAAGGTFTKSLYNGTYDQRFINSIIQI